MPFFNHPRPLVFAHRGGCALGPENTLAAFDQGVAAGADGLELDVHLSSDGVPVVIHDSTLDRTTDQIGPVAGQTSAQLAGVDAAYRFERDGSFPYRGRNIGIPTLRQVLARYRDVPIIIEMKVDSAAIGEAVARDIRLASATPRVCVAGYGSRCAAAVRTALPEVACSATHLEVRLAVYRSWVGWPSRRARYGGFQVPEAADGHRIVTPRFVRYARRAGLDVQVWTVDEERDMTRLLDWGVEGLITNRPDLAVQLRDRWCRETRGVVRPGSD